ncbi:MAG: ferritin family protein [Chloroflexota bacterium]|nr:ferritin family protein [Chloroflexota bacterium]
MKPSEEALRAIEKAIQIEKDGAAFYDEAAKQTADPSGKKMFQSLARDEKAHLKLFETVRASLLQEGHWLSPEQVAAIGPQRRAHPPIFPTGDEIKAKDVPERELAALQRGIQAEEDSISFYSEAREQTADPDGKALYTYLIEQEQGHRTILQGEYDYLTNTGFWFDVREFDLEAA